MSENLRGFPSGWYGTAEMDVIGSGSGQSLYRRFVIPANTLETFSIQAPPTESIILSYWVEGTSGGTADIEIVERWQGNASRVNRLQCGPFGAGDVMVSGALTVQTTASVHGQVIINFALRPAQVVNDTPPLSSSVNCVAPAGAGAPGPFIAPGPFNGWCPPRRCKLNIQTEGAIVVRYLDAAGATVATVLAPDPVNGTINIEHPPIYRIQLAHNGDGSLTDRVAVLTWKRT